MRTRVRRLHRRKQAGFGLIEAVVTVGIVSACIVTLVGALAVAEKDAGTETQQAHVQVALRTLGDDLRSVVSYNECPGANTYRNLLGSMAPSGVTVVSVALGRPASGTALSSETCSGGATDYGFQRLTLTVREGSASGSIEVWKSESTTASAASPTP